MQCVVVHAEPRRLDFQPWRLAEVLAAAVARAARPPRRRVLPFGAASGRAEVSR